MSGNGTDQRKPMPGREAMRPPLPRRFYKAVAHGPADAGDPAARQVILLDGRRARTPGRVELVVPSVALAEAIAAEWAAQTNEIDPARMPLTRLANTAIDGVALRMRDVGDDIVKFAGSDLLCYRAGHPAGLVERQGALWDPILQWAAQEHGARFERATGIMPVAQPGEAVAAIAKAVAPLDAFRLTALHVMTTLTGSALLGLAVVEGFITANEAWSAAHVDEDWQIANWGEDAEAKARRARRWGEMAAAARLIAMLD